MSEARTGEPGGPKGRGGGRVRGQGAASPLFTSYGVDGALQDLGLTKFDGKILRGHEPSCLIIGSAVCDLKPVPVLSGLLQFAAVYDGAKKYPESRGCTCTLRSCLQAPIIWSQQVGRRHHDFTAPVLPPGESV